MPPAVLQPTWALWGPPRLVRPGRPELHFSAERRFQLLALLALNGERGVERDRAAMMLWPEHPLPEARRNLRKVLHLAHALVPEVQADEHRIAWNPATDWQAFEAAMAQGRCAEALQILPPLAPAEPLAGLSDRRHTELDEWFARQRRRLLDRWLVLMLDALRAPGLAAEQRAALAQRLLHEDPLHEEAVGVLIGQDRAAGREADAARRYRAYAGRLADEFGVEPSRALRECLDAASVHEPSRAAPTSPSGASDAPRPPGTRAPDADALIGRRLEMAEAEAILAEPGSRLLTLLGPGGVGKSRLAKALLHTLAPRHPGGAHWVDLQDLDDLAAAVGRMAQRLGVSVPDPAQAARQLTHGLGEGPALLVLDNLEHLADGLRPLLRELLAQAPRLTLLATSRIRIGLAEERVLPLQGLAVPDDHSRDLQAGRSFDAVRLFELRATQARRDFDLARDWPAVLGIVDALGGLPLALELAASWVRVLPTATIAGDLRGSLDLLQLEPGHGNPPQRHEHDSMQRVLERSWALLSAAERAALEGLSVFEGGADRAAARAVAACPLPLAMALVDKGLVAADERGRFVLHPLVATFAGGRRRADAARDAALRDAHAAWFASCAEALRPHATGHARLLIDGVEAELANLRLAWRHAVAARRPDRIAAMTRTLWAFYEFRARQVEGIEEMWPALAAVSAAEVQGLAAARLARSRLAQGLSLLLHRSGRNAEALDLARSAADAAADCGDVEAHAGCLLNTGMCLMSAGQVPEALPWFERGIAVAAERGDARCVAWGRGNLAVAWIYLQRHDEAYALLEQALQGCREAGDLYNVAVQLHNLAASDCFASRWDKAFENIAAAGAVAETSGLSELALKVVVLYARLLRARGRLGPARIEYERAIQLGERAGSSLSVLIARIGLAEVDFAEGRRAAGLVRAQAVVRDAMALGLPAFAAQACGVAADGVAAQGDLRTAIGLWKLSLETRMPDTHRLRELESRIQAAGAEYAACPATPLVEAVPLVLALEPDDAGSGVAEARR